MQHEKPHTDVEITKAVEDFLKAVFTLHSHDERVTTNELAEVLQRTQPTVTDMAQRLMTAGLIDYQKYKGVMLTETGQEIALKMIRRHRLIELYLVRELGYELPEVHDEAERLEHAVSDRFIEALAQRLGNPQLDPHGDIIPAADGTMAERELVPLSELADATPATISRLRATNPDMLQHMLDRGFALGAQVEVTTRDPFEGPINTRVNGEQRVLGHAVAACIDVEVGD
ncbi:MAG: metal-dependent transcriptional regulator [Chloroflexota bacterium]|nr:metal-dependent transcriptional regulator [Chloroflexota bacterium]